VARLRPGARPPRIEVPPPAISFDVAALTLYRSHLSRGGAEYERIGSTTRFAPHDRAR
jgi:2'-5' RNA ligase